MAVDQLDPSAGRPPDAIVAVHDRLRRATLTGEDGLVHARDGLEVSAAPGRGRDASCRCGRGEEAESKGEEQAFHAIHLKGSCQQAGKDRAR